MNLISKEWYEGYYDYLDGKSRRDNPYQEREQEDNWYKGFDEGLSDD